MEGGAGTIPGNFTSNGWLIVVKLKDQGPMEKVPMMRGKEEVLVGGE